MDHIIKVANKRKDGNALDIAARYSNVSVIGATSTQELEKRFITKNPEGKWTKCHCQMCDVQFYEGDMHIFSNNHKKNVAFNANMDMLLGKSRVPRINGMGFQPGPSGLIDPDAVSAYWGERTHLFHKSLALKVAGSGFNVRLKKGRTVFVPTSRLNALVPALVSYQSGQGKYGSANKVIWWHELPRKARIPKDHQWWPIAIMSFKPEEAARLKVEDWFGETPSELEDADEDDPMFVEADDEGDVSTSVGVASEAASSSSTVCTTLSIASCGRQGEDEVPDAWPIRITRSRM
jgi:hypothetical protein